MPIESGNILTGGAFDAGGDLATWTETTGTWEVVASHGSAVPWAGAGFTKPTDASASPAELRQEHDLTASLVTADDIDGGFVSFDFEVYYRTRVGDGDTVRIIVETLDAGLLVTNTFDSGELDPNENWFKHSIQAVFASGDRHIRVRLLGTQNTVGDGFNSYFDEASLNIITGVPSAKIVQMLDSLSFYNKFDGATANEPELAFDMTEGVFNGTAARDVSGLYGKAYRGTDATADLTAPSYQQLEEQPITFAAWIYMEALPSAMFGGAVRSIVRIGTGTVDGAILGIVDASDDIVFQAVDDALSVYTASMTITAPDLNKWIHVVGVGTNSTVKIYKDGVLEDNQVLSGNIKYDTVTDIVIGENFEGKIDEVKVWGRELQLDDGGGFDEIRAAALEVEFLDTRDFLYPDFTDGFAEYLDLPFGVAAVIPTFADNVAALKASDASIVESTDGRDWSAGTAASVAANTFTSLVYNPFTRYWLASDDTGHVYSTRDLRGSWVDQGDITGGGIAIRNLAFAGDVIFALGDGGLLLTSPDGSTWTSRTSGVGTALRAATWSGQNYIVAGDSSVILTSADLATWAPQTADAALNITGLARNLDAVVAVSSGGNIDISTDHGVTWADAVPGTGAADLNDVSFGNYTFVAVGASGTVLVGAADASSWAVASSVPVAGDITHVEHVRLGGWVAGGVDDLISSTDGDFWTAETSALGGGIGGLHAKSAAALGGLNVQGQLVLDASNTYGIDFDTGKFPYTDSPFLFLILPRDPAPNLTASDLDCDTDELTASVTYGPTDTTPLSAGYWEVEIELGVAYLRINQVEVSLPDTGNTTIPLSYTLPTGIDLSGKRIRYVLEACNEPIPQVWMSSWMTLTDCTGGGGGPAPNPGVGNTVIAALVINIYDPVETEQYVVEVLPQINTDSADDYWWDSLRLDDDDIPPRIVDPSNKQLVLETMPPGRYHYRFTATFTGNPTQQQDFILLVRPDSDATNV